jgi:oxaloacetate decarboxylase alpha subunit/pyruvate carboxylase subunit B
MADKFNEVVREIPVVREALGWIPLVTPTSQIVGTQAMMNVMLGRWKMICQPAQDIALGKYGKAPGPIHPEILAMAEKQSGTMAVTVRPADLLKPGLEDYRRQCAAKGLPVDDETAVLFAMFPQQVEALVKGPPPAPPVARNSSPAPVTRVSLAAPNGGSLRTMVLNIDGKRHEVSVQKMDA